MEKRRTGDIFILIEMVMWSLFPIVTQLTYKSLQPLATAAISTFLAALFFAFVLTYKRSWHELKKREAWKDILLVTLIIGIVIYALVFTGVRMTSAGNASIALLMEVFFAFAILGIWNKEKVYKKNIFGAVLMVAGAAIIFFPKSNHINWGDMILIGAIAIAPFGNFFQKRAREKVGSAAILFIRSALSAVFLGFLALVFSQAPLFREVINSLGFLLINGVMFMGLSKILWIEGIHRIPITRANTLSTMIPLFTLFFSFIILKEAPTMWQILGLVPMLIGAWLVLAKHETLNIDYLGR